VRRVGPRRVEGHTPGAPVQTLGPGKHLVPGVLLNPVTVEAPYDRHAGHRATLRSLLQLQGYDDLEAVRNEGGSMAGPWARRKAGPRARPKASSWAS
jgi:hypothetical protein